ncbi:SPL family radical SAM protein [Abyssisolibacter fermentans]|uniref:SPL family radical SAM protein n=1 Tax=Abyssisolibacter fermentans TaxID=1766203 RepID=UPI00082FE9C0|nr:radical SAM protein [Abyssisolibacter fermentans]
MHYKKAKAILSAQNGMNLYRGCTHGCIYCDSRSSCYNMNHDFEDIEIKSNAIELLEMTLRRKRKKCMIGTGAMCDPYMHVENEIKQTRKALEIIDRYGFGLAIQTKSNLILRDLDILKSINAKSKCVVQMTLTTYDEDLCKKIEPNVCSTKERVEVLKIMNENNIPTVVWLSPILPYINDTEENIRGLLDYCIKAKVYGVICFGMGLTLRDGNRQYYYSKLDEHFPHLKSKYIKKYGCRYEIRSDRHNELLNILFSECKKHGIETDINKIFKYMRTFEEKNSGIQMSLFDNIDD